MTDSLLYIISPPRINDEAAFAEQLSRVLAAGGARIGAFQLRLKQRGTAGQGRLTDEPATREDILRISEQLLPICRQAEVPLLMNDDPHLANEAGADGVHLGQEDASVEVARALLGPEAVIGVSCHASAHLAMEAGEAGADYVAFGAFYPTRSKTAEALAHWGTPEPDILRWWSTYTVLPCVAIGGITPQNAPPLIDAGADFIAVLSAIWEHPDGPEQAARAFCDLL